MVNNKKAGKNVSTMEALLGPELLTDVEKTESTAARMKGKDLLMLYFSASWCPPCKAFTPDLSEFYKKHCIPNGVEIVYISSDSDVPSFKEYFGKMPWTSLPMIGSSEVKQNLATSLKISGIPSLVVLDAKTGRFISDDAKSDVSSAHKDDEKSKELIQKWKNTEAVPIEEAQLSGTGPDGMVMKVIKTILTNPTYIIGLIFFAKKLMKYLEELGSEEEEL